MTRASPVLAGPRDCPERSAGPRPGCKSTAGEAGGEAGARVDPAQAAAAGEGQPQPEAASLTRRQAQQEPCKVGWGAMIPKLLWISSGNFSILVFFLSLSFLMLKFEYARLVS